MSVVLITGCGSGIGRASALYLARRGHAVFAGVRRPESGDGLKREAGDGSSITPVRIDVRDPSRVDHAVSEVLAAAGRIDVLVNNAGISMFAATEEISDEDALAMFDTNVLGPLRLMRAVLPAMRAQRSGTIFNVSSLAGFAPRPYQSLYSASKHALDAMSFSLGAEVRDFGIRVVVLSPGRFKSESVRNMLAPGRETDEPEYRAIGERKIQDFITGSAGSDPAEVGRIIEEWMDSDRPPARIFVGDDSRRLADERRTVSDDEYAAIIARGLAPYKQAVSGRDQL